MTAEHLLKMIICVDSLKKAIKEADGGDGLLKQYLDKPLSDFITDIASKNNINFIYQGPVERRFYAANADPRTGY